MSDSAYGPTRHFCDTVLARMGVETTYYDPQVGAAIEALIRQVSSPVRWEDVVRRLASEGVTRYVEVGPGKALSGMIKRIVSGATIYNVEGPDDLAAIEALS